MTLKEKQAALQGIIVDGWDCGYVVFDRDSVCLDGHFSVKELEGILRILKEPVNG